MMVMSTKKKGETKDPPILEIASKLQFLYNSSTANRSKKQCEQIIFGNTNLCWGLGPSIFTPFFSLSSLVCFPFFLLCKSPAESKARARVRALCHVEKEKYKGLEGVWKIRDWFSIWQGTRDLYSRCSMRAAAISYQHWVAGTSSTAPAQSVKHSTCPRLYTARSRYGIWLYKTEAVPRAAQLGLTVLFLSGFI
ncbi:hypothetical protein HOY82DRAFT_361248 [Tuber indicum]|nr:hypothetical protein HOY82DRAFT_361248 [Tuber indicum]